MADSDRELVQRVLEGDRDAFAVLMERYASLVHGILLERVRRPDEVEDLVQDTFVRAYQRLASLRDRGRFGPWVCRVAANLAVEWHRRHALIARTERREEVHLRVADTPDEALERRQEADILWQALDRLSPEHRRVLVLYYIEGCPQAAIARFLGIARATVKWRLGRARARLQEDLTELFGAELALRSRNLQRFREKAMAGLPAMVFLRPRRATAWTRAGRMALVGAGLAGVVALGGALSQRVRTVSARRAETADARGLRVRYAPQALPEHSVFALPPHPHPGSEIRLQVTGRGQGVAFLHYTFSLQDPRDQVVPVEWEGDTGVARVSLPRGSTNFYYHLSDAQEPATFPEGFGQGRRERLQAYRHVLALRGADGRPVEGAQFGVGVWSEVQGRDPGEALMYYDREAALYPRNTRAYKARWGVLQWRWEDPEWGYAQVKRERAELLARFGGDPDLAWELVDEMDTASMARFRESFPDDPRAAAAAYATTVRPYSEYAARAPRLRRFLREYPTSAYVIDAYRDLLYLYEHTNPARARSLADSLIDGTLVPHYDPEQERGKKHLTLTGVYGGAYPQSVAYLTRLRGDLAAADTVAALALARRLLRSGLDDPIPYLFTAEALPAQALAESLLVRAEPWTRAEHVTGLPGFMVRGGDPPYMAVYQRQRAESLRSRLLRQLGAWYARHGRPERAAGLLAEAATLQEGLDSRHYVENAEAVYLLLARVHEELGNCAEALAANEQLLRRSVHHPRAEAAVRRLWRAGCGAELGPDERLASVRQRLGGFCAETLDPERAGADSLCVSPSAPTVRLVYRDNGLVTEHKLQELERLAAWQRRFGPRGLQVVWVLEDGLIYGGKVEGPQRPRDELQAAVQEHDYPFTTLVTRGGEWPEELAGPEWYSRVLAVVDTAGYVRLRQVRSWQDSTRVRQDGEVEGLLEGLLGGAARGRTRAAEVASRDRGHGRR